MVLSAVLMAAVVAVAQSPAPVLHSPDVQARLGYLVGDWTIEGLSGKVFRQKCSWYTSRSLVVCTFEDRRDGSTGQSVFGYSELQGRYINQRFDSKGGSQHQLGYASGLYGIVFTDERLESDGTARVQTTLNLEHEGLRYTQYRSVEGRLWQRTADFRYVPVSQPRSARRRGRTLRRR
jgi:hypothetical protein